MTDRAASRAMAAGAGMVGAADRPSLRDMLAGAHGGVLLVGITPPRRSASREQVSEIAEVTVARLAHLNLDGLILYDIDDESDRNANERPYPYLPTMDPAEFHIEHLRAWRRPVVIYRCVGKYPEADLRTWLRSADIDQVMGNAT